MQSSSALNLPILPGDGRPTAQSDVKPERKLKITAKVRAAIHNMIWLGLKRDAAAEAAGIRDNSLYIALRRPDVKAFYLRELDVLRTSERARNIHVLAEIREQTGNQMARVQAVKTLEQISDAEQQTGRGSQLTPGLVIVIEGRSSLEVGPSMKQINGLVPDGG
jgi:hypothetical protein